MESKILWNRLDTKITELKDIEISKRKYNFLYEGSQFKVTYYICPCCKERLLYMANIDEKLRVVSGQSNLKVASMFTCAYCRVFYVSEKNEKLTDGKGYKLEHLNRDVYFDLLRDMEKLEEKIAL